MAAADFSVQTRKALREQLEEAKALLASRQLSLNAERALCTRLVRLIETLVDGKPTTELTSSHHA